MERRSIAVYVYAHNNVCDLYGKCGMKKREVPLQRRLTRLNIYTVTA